MGKKETSLNKLTNSLDTITNNNNFPFKIELLMILDFIFYRLFFLLYFFFSFSEYLTIKKKHSNNKKLDRVAENEGEDVLRFSEIREQQQSNREPPKKSKKRKRKRLRKQKDEETIIKDEDFLLRDNKSNYNNSSSTNENTRKHYD